MVDEASPLRWWLATTEAAALWTWRQMRARGTIGHRSPRARRFGSFGPGTIVGFPSVIVNERAIHLGRDVVIASDATVTAGWGIGMRGLPDVVVRIGDRSLVGAGSSVIGHALIDIGCDVWTGRNVHITDMNHGYSRLDAPISEQWQGPEPISIGDGSWLGHGVVVLAGARIGRHVAVGANSVVRGELPDRCVAVGAPARVVRRHDPERGWLAVARDGTETPDDPDRRQLEQLAVALEHADHAEREAVAALAAALRRTGSHDG
jgi:acetyltransferase-like isoleucine patch superfamily enzyme